MKTHIHFQFFVIWSISASVLSTTAWKAPTSSWFLSELAMFLKIDPQCFGLFGKFQDTNEICMCFQTVFPFLVTMMSIKKNSNLFLRKNFMSTQFKCTCSNSKTKKFSLKNGMCKLKLILMVTRESLVFVSQFTKKKVIFWYSDFLGRWEKLYHGKWKLYHISQIIIH